MLIALQFYKVIYEIFFSIVFTSWKIDRKHILMFPVRARLTAAPLTHAFGGTHHWVIGSDLG